MPFATVRNTRMFYRLQGNAGRPVLILSHSIGTDHAMWDPQIEDLSPHFQILRYDTRGHGASDAPAGEYSIEMLGGDVLGLADALGISQFAFCGLSLGGAIGQWVAAHAPERVTHLVLANTSPQFVPRANWEIANCGGAPGRDVRDRRSCDATIVLSVDAGKKKSPCRFDPLGLVRDQSGGIPGVLCGASRPGSREPVTADSGSNSDHRR